MSRIREEIPLVENVGAGKKTIIRPAVGRSWLEWHIEHTNVTLAQMTNIKIKLVSPTRTITLQKWKDGVELDNYNKRYARHTAAGTLSIYFYRPELEDELQRSFFILGTGGLTAVRVEFDIDAAAVNPAIAAWGKKTAQRPITSSLLTYVEDHERGDAAAGDNHFDSLDARDRLAAIHILNDKVDHVEYKVDNAIAFDLNRARSDFDQTGNGRVPYAAGYGFCVDFLLAGVIDEALVMQDVEQDYQVHQHRLTSTLGAGPSANIRYLAEYITTFPALA